MAIDELVKRMKSLRNPSVIGLDPRLSYIPASIRDEFLKEGADPLEAASESILAYNIAIIDEIWDVVPAVKPQIAFYEEYGWRGIKAYMETAAYAKKKGLLVIGDIKRGDVSSTADAYADSHLGKVDIFGKKLAVYDEDFATINPYLGFDSIEPFLRNCRDYGKGVFVLVKTSNPESGQLQDLMADSPFGKAPLHEIVGRLVSQWGEDLIGDCGYSEVGAVTGVTHPAQAKRLRELMPHTLFLAPGYGAQGAKAHDIADGSIVNSSRGVIAAHLRAPYKDAFGEEAFAKAARAAAIDMREDLSCLKI
jgi:orotidine-5'-phosphate decarboxylase